MKIAVLGGGILGCCTALELARRGYAVDLYDASSSLLSKASYFNEGKIHTGIIYARDESLETAQLLIDGAIHFQQALSRWIDVEGSLVSSSPFLYCVANDSLVNSDDLESYYGECQSLFNETWQQSGLSYLGRGTGLEFRRLEESEWDSGINPEYFDALFETNEYAVDPTVIAARLNDAVRVSPKVRLRLEHYVESVEDTSSGNLEVVIRDPKGVRHSEIYDQVVNCLWQDRLRLDIGRGIPAPKTWMHRYKFSNRIHAPIPETVPSLTIVLGPYGDIVNYRGQSLFLSWYPTGIGGISSEVTPPDWDATITDEHRLEVFWASYEAWCKRCPALRQLEFDESQLELGGGVIYALGSTDVDDYDSKLHDRYEVGIESYGNYHSVDTGKYTLAPMLAVRVADRILG